MQAVEVAQSAVQQQGETEVEFSPATMFLSQRRSHTSGASYQIPSYDHVNKWYYNKHLYPSALLWARDYANVDIWLRALLPQKVSSQSWRWSLAVNSPGLLCFRRRWASHLKCGSNPVHHFCPCFQNVSIAVDLIGILFLPAAQLSQSPWKRNSSTQIKAYPQIQQILLELKAKCAQCKDI